MPTVPFRSYEYTQTEITDIGVDPIGFNYIWAGFQKNSDDVCILAKIGAHDLFQVYYEIELEVEAINRIIYDNNYIYLAVDDDQYIGYRYSSNNPLSVSTAISIPTGINEAPIDVVTDDTNLYFLIPGEISGQNAKICKFTLSGTFVETIDLATVDNASSFTIDPATGDIWLVTYEAPTKYVRVYYDGTWNYTIN